jgi:tRNA dimethylallyltransferase
MEKPKIIVICGPTGIGKTAAAIRIAAEIEGQIISADSMQVYRYMDIGTAKPTPLENYKCRLYAGLQIYGHRNSQTYPTRAAEG